MSSTALLGLTAAERIETLERALDQAAKDVAAAREFAEAVELERDSLREDLRAALILGEFTEKMPHLHVDWPKGQYTLRRTFDLTFKNHAQAMQTLRTLRALLNPAAQGGPLNDNGVHHGHQRT